MNKRQKIVVIIGSVLILAAIMLRPIEMHGTASSGRIYRDVAEISPLWMWWIHRHDDLNFYSYPHSYDLGNGQRRDYDINWTLYLLSVTTALALTGFSFYRVRNRKQPPNTALEPTPTAPSVLTKP
jgi:hypothetical protein